MHSVLTVLLLGATCTDSFVAMMERGSNMREMRLAKSGCHAMIFAAVNTLMLALGMGVSSTLRSSLSLEEGRILPACFLMLGYADPRRSARLSAHGAASADERDVPDLVRGDLCGTVDRLLSGRCLSADHDRRHLHGLLCHDAVSAAAGLSAGI